MKLLHKGLVTNFFSLSLVQVANSLLPIITFPIIARIIGPEKFGAISFAAAAVTYFTLLINYGFDLSSTRTIARNKNNIPERNKVFSEVLFAKLFLLGISSLLFILVLVSVPQFSGEKKLMVFTFLSCFASVITPNWFYQGMQQLYRVALFNFLSKLLFTVSILFVIREQKDYLLQPLILSVSSILVASGSFIWAIKKYKIKIHAIGIKSIFRVLWRQKTIFFSGVVINLYTTTNIIILGMVQTTRDVAFFSAASKMIIISQTLISTPLSLSLFPFIGESFGQGKSYGIDRLKRIAPFITVFTFIAGILLWIAAPLIISVFFGAAFYEATTVLRILCFIPLIITVSDLLGIQTMINLNMDRPFFYITFIGALFGLLLTFFLSKHFGAKGTAWAWILSEVIITSGMWLYLLSNKIQLFDSTYFRFNHFVEVARPFIYSIRNKIYKSQST